MPAHNPLANLGTATRHGAAVAAMHGRPLPTVTVQHPAAAHAILSSRQPVVTTLSGSVVPASQASAIAHADDHSNRVGRAVIARTTATVSPELREIHSMLLERKQQIQATAEHRRIEAERRFRASVIARLQRIEAETMFHDNDRGWHRY